MKYTPLHIAVLIVCGLCVTSVSAVPVIVGFRDMPRVQIRGSSDGITLMAVSRDNSAPGIALTPCKGPVPDIDAAAVDLSDEEITALRQVGR